ncbi:MAG TPA: hypothetical protein VJ866_12490 [Pyrinomonadaceae bacterium]|nr:hypothetical protein [Pyrinomonadaceae bacterium]
MSDKFRRHRERGQRVLLLMRTFEPDFPAGSKGSTLTSSLEGKLADSDALEVKRADSARKRKQGTEARGDARTAGRRMLKTTSDTAEPLTLDYPEMKGLFKPAGKSNNDAELVVAMRSVVNAAAQYAARLTESGLPPAFFEQMVAKADDIEIAAAQQDEAVREGVAATAALEDLHRQIDEIIERLDPLVRNKYAGDPAKLAAWESASRLERAPHHGDDDDEDDDDDTNTNNNPNTPPPPANP